MRIPLPAAAVFVLAMLWPAVAEAQLGRRYREQGDPWGGSIFLFGGQKQLDEDDWDPVDTHLALGALADITPPNWPVSIAFNTIFSTDSDSEGGLDLDGTTWEINLGVRKYFDFADDFRLFVSGGVAYATATIEISGSGADISEDANGIGFWADTGVLYRIGERFSIGFTVGYTAVEVDFDNFDAEAGGLRYGLIVGWQW